MLQDATSRLHISMPIKVMQHLENQGYYMKIQLSESYLTYRHLNNNGKIVVMMLYYPPFIRAIHKHNTKAMGR